MKLKFAYRETFLRLWCLTMVTCFVSDTIAQEYLDSLHVIQEITFWGDMRYQEAIAPQEIRGELLQKVNAHTVADAIRWMSGVQLKDYGGIGGLKTVNLRSMGSQHVGIYYDGIELGNAQNGVIDLGQFSLDNVDRISLYHGQRSAVFQTASDFANAGSIYIRTTRPDYGAPKTRIKLQQGSCSTTRASLMHSRTLSDRIALNANVEFLNSTGKYPFTYRRRNYDGSIAYDTTAIRANGDIRSFRAETNLFGKILNGNWQGKLYTFNADRGIPGAIVNNVWRRGERQTDNNFLAQFSLLKEESDAFATRVQAKYAHYRSHYLNMDTTVLQIDNTYHQQEAYANVTQVGEFLNKHASISLSYDIRWNHLDADIPQFAHPDRWSHLFAIANAWSFDSIRVQASGVYSWIIDKSQGKTHNTQKITPALFLHYGLTKNIQFNGYAKRSFRMPTFNDLYYTEIGNAFLKPEVATQYLLGIKLTLNPRHVFHSELDIDLYHNNIENKIVAYPKGQQFRWTMLNLGEVSIDGLEIRANGTYYLSDQIQLSSILQYTYQKAIDITDKNDSYYQDQIPYTPWHSGSASLMIDYSNYSFAYNFVYTGERYCQMENIRYNHLEPWYTSDLTLSAKFRKFRLTAEVRNLFDQQYDVIINYPMPGRNYNFTIQCEL